MSVFEIDADLLENFEILCIRYAGKYCVVDQIQSNCLFIFSKYGFFFFFFFFYPIRLMRIVLHYEILIPDWP
jgi:hypothetical protein